jgi:hypothetical protein
MRRKSKPIKADKQINRRQINLEFYAGIDRNQNIPIRGIVMAIVILPD